MNWIILTIFSIIARSTYGIATKIMSKSVIVSSMTQTVLLGLFGGFLSIPLSFFVGGINFEGVMSVPGATLLMVVSQGLGNILFFKGLKSLGAGTAQIAFSSILVWGGILSTLFLGSRFTITQVIGMIIMLLAILLVQYNKNGFKFNKGVLMIIGSAGLFSVFQVASADISSIVSTGAYLILNYFGSSVIVAVFYLNKILKDLSIITSQLKETMIATLFASGASLLYFLFSYFAYQIAPDKGIVVVLLTSQVMLSIIFGFIFLKEHENMGKKLIAGVMAFLAATLMLS